MGSYLRIEYLVVINWELLKPYERERLVVTVGGLLFGIEVSYDLAFKKLNKKKQSSTFIFPFYVAP